MVPTFPSYLEAAAERPEGWRTDAVVDRYDPTGKVPLSYRYFNVPPVEDELDIAFEAKHEKPMEDIQRFLIAMTVSGDAA